MKQWLEERGKPTEMEHDMSHMNMAGMDHSKWTTGAKWLCRC